MIKIPRKRNSTARMRSNYRNTTGCCLELFYMLESFHQGSQIEVSVRGEDIVEKKVLTIRRESINWRRMCIGLPSGLNQIIIDGLMTKGSNNSAAVDDITMAPCQVFGK